MSEIHFTRILVVDDDATCLYLTESLIEDLQLADHITTANNGQEALALVELNCSSTVSGNCPELILLDLNMPVMDGFEFLEALWQKAVIPEKGVKVIILTSSNSGKDRQKALSYPVVGYLTKPITEEKLLQVIS